MNQNNNEVQTKAKLSFIKGKKLHEYVFDLTNPADIRKYNQALKLDDDKRNTYLLLLSREQLKDRDPNATHIHQMKLIEEQPNPALSELKRSEKKSELEKKKDRLNYLTNKAELTEEEEAEFKRLPNEIEKLESDIQELKTESDTSESSTTTSKLTNSKSLVATFNKINKKMGNVLTTNDLKKILTSNDIIPALTEAVRRAQKIHKLNIKNLNEVDSIIYTYADQLKAGEKLTTMFLKKSQEKFKRNDDWIACFNLFQYIPDDLKVKILQQMDWTTTSIDVFKDKFMSLIADTKSFEVFMMALENIKELEWFGEAIMNEYSAYDTQNENINNFVITHKENLIDSIKKKLSTFLKTSITLAKEKKKSSFVFKIFNSNSIWYCGYASKSEIPEKTKENFQTVLEKIQTAFDGDFEFEIYTDAKKTSPFLTKEFTNNAYVSGGIEMMTKLFIMLHYFKNGDLIFNRDLNPDLIYNTPFNIEKLPPTIVEETPVITPKTSPRIGMKGEIIEEAVDFAKKDMKELKEEKEIKKEEKEIKEENTDDEETETEDDDKMMGKGLSENDYQHIKTELQTIKSLLFTVIYKMNKKDRDKYNKKNKSGSFNWLFD